MLRSGGLFMITSPTVTRKLSVSLLRFFVRRFIPAQRGISPTISLFRLFEVIPGASKNIAI
jgi:hypothetical protein